MVLGIDTDVLVSWMMIGANRHKAVRALVARETQKANSIGITPQVIFEFIHICTDPRRFEHPLEMNEATAVCTELWNATEVVQVLPEPTIVYETLDLLDRLNLGRKRILDTALAVTLKQAGINRLATLNKKDFEVFPFLEIIVP
jgi:predicted nucleic acid-binding protein